MIYSPGDIIEVEEFQLPNETKNKFFIFITSNFAIPYMVTTTSQKYVDEKFIKHGKIVDRSYIAHCFKAGVVIGRKGFSFNKDTLIHTRNNVWKYDEKVFEAYNVLYHDYLIKEEYIDLLYTLYGSPYTMKELKEDIESILYDLTK